MSQEQPKFVPTAVKSAFTNQTMLFTPDEAVEYQKLTKTFIDHYRPVGFEEELLVQSIIDLEWRTLRITSLEMGLHAVARLALADDVPAHLIPAHTYLKYQKEFKDLSNQENRLRRYFDKDLKRLTTLQAARMQVEMIRRKNAEARAKQQQQQQPQPESKTASVNPLTMQDIYPPFKKSAA